MGSREPRVDTEEEGRAKDGEKKEEKNDSVIEISCDKYHGRRQSMDVIDRVVDEALNDDRRVSGYTIFMDQ